MSNFNPDFEYDGSEDEEQVVHHVSQRKKRRKGVGGEEMELQLTSMIDVIFQLLIYFVITANFAIYEGTIQATLPGSNNPNEIDRMDELQMLTIEVTSPTTGPSYTIKIDNLEIPGGATGLYDYLITEINLGHLDKAERIVQIAPKGHVRWQHVVNIFNACVRAELEKIGFAP